MAAKIQVVAISVGMPEYSRYSLPVIKDYFDRHNIAFSYVTDVPDTLFPQNNVVIRREEEPKKSHPSWWKLITPKFFDADFIICWDLDLLPAAKNVEVVNHFDLTKLNMCREPAITYYGFNGKQFKHFHYNGGLIGVPKSLFQWFQDIYYQHAPGTKPCWEQFYLNEHIHDDAVPFHELLQALNISFPVSSNPQEPWKNAINKHYTWGCMDANFRLEQIRRHHDEYFSVA